MSPSRPYETRSLSSTCAGRPAPSRPATYLTSGAYVRMSRSRGAARSGAACTASRGSGRLRPAPRPEGYEPQRRRTVGELTHPAPSAPAATATIHCARRSPRRPSTPTKQTAIPRNSTPSESALRGGPRSESRGVIDPARVQFAHPKGSSSIGRAPVSKTGGCRFESCLPCPRRLSRKAASEQGGFCVSQPRGLPLETAGNRCSGNPHGAHMVRTRLARGQGADTGFEPSCNRPVPRPGTAPGTAPREHVLPVARRDARVGGRATNRQAA